MAHLPFLLEMQWLTAVPTANSVTFRGCWVVSKMHVYKGRNLLQMIIQNKCRILESTCIVTKDAIKEHVNMKAISKLC